MLETMQTLENDREKNKKAKKAEHKNEPSQQSDPSEAINSFERELANEYSIDLHAPEAPKEEDVPLKSAAELAMERVKAPEREEGALVAPTSEEREALKQERLGSLAKDIYSKRMSGEIAYKEVDRMITEAGLTPGTPEAGEFMSTWDWSQAEGVYNNVSSSIDHQIEDCKAKIAALDAEYGKIQDATGEQVAAEEARVTAGKEKDRTTPKDEKKGGKGAVVKSKKTTKTDPLQESYRKVKGGRDSSIEGEILAYEQKIHDLERKRDSFMYGTERSSGEANEEEPKEEQPGGGGREITLEDGTKVRVGETYDVPLAAGEGTKRVRVTGFDERGLSAQFEILNENGKVVGNEGGGIQALSGAQRVEGLPGVVGADGERPVLGSAMGVVSKKEKPKPRFQWLRKALRSLFGGGEQERRAERATRVGSSSSSDEAPKEETNDNDRQAA